jgi:L,D-transpeptidase catalytic domain
MVLHRHPGLPLAFALIAASLLVGLVPSPAQAAPFYYRWEPSYRYHSEPLWHPSRKHVQREAPPPRRAAVRGPLLIAVSIAHQEAKIFSGTTEIATTPVSTGVPDHPTPMGVFAVIQKQVYHESNIYSAAPMPHMQRLTWSGIALHGGVVPGHPASHGCIRLPRDFAARLYGMTKIGARVLVTYDDATPFEIAHKSLLQPKEVQPTADPKTAALDLDTASKITEAPRSDVTASITPAATPAPSPAQPPAAKTRQRGALSIFISRKQGKLYVRDHLEPLLEMPISMSSPEKPIGTHVFTAAEPADGSKQLRWNVVSIPSALPKRAKARVELSARERRKGVTALPQAAALPSAAEALDRIDIPPEVRDRVADLLSPGASLIISDNPLSDETGEDTDFVVLTP